MEYTKTLSDSNLEKAPKKSHSDQMFDYQTKIISDLHEAMQLSNILNSKILGNTVADGSTEDRELPSSFFVRSQYQLDYMQELITEILHNLNQLNREF